jgi:hypothetical protein
VLANLRHPQLGVVTRDSPPSPNMRMARGPLISRNPSRSAAGLQIRLILADSTVQVLTGEDSYLISDTCRKRWRITGTRA